MSSAKLSLTNPYLRDAAIRERSVLASVASSSAIEGIHAPFKQKSVSVKSSKLLLSGKPSLANLIRAKR